MTLTAALLLGATLATPMASSARDPAVLAEGLGWATFTSTATGSVCNEKVAIQLEYTPATSTTPESYAVVMNLVEAATCQVGYTAYPLMAWRRVSLPGDEVCTNSGNLGTVSCDDGFYVSWDIDTYGNFNFEKQPDNSHLDITAAGTLVRLS